LTGEKEFFEKEILAEDVTEEKAKIGLEQVWGKEGAGKDHSFSENGSATSFQKKSCSPRRGGSL